MKVAIRYCNLCGISFELKPRLGAIWAEKTNRGRYCSDQCSRSARKGISSSRITEFKKGQDPTLHWNWNGGRTITPYGYVHIHKPNHPFANNRGYIFEHRYIMEQHLGRCLTKSEVVHHMNHDKQDNRIENLKLFSSHGNQPRYKLASKMKIAKLLLIRRPRQLSD